MEIKTISNNSLKLIDAYKIVPYFNNRTKARRGGLRVNIGKGSIREINEELENISIQEKFNLKDLNDFDKKKILSQYNIGIECSGFAYYLLDQESIDRGLGELEKKLNFPLSNGIFGRLRAIFRPVENANAKTFAHNKNSKEISLKEIKPGDYITMIGNNDGLGERDHIVVIYKVEYENSIPNKIYYAHAIAWPEHGQYGHGINKGIIEVLDINKSILDQKWIENDKNGIDNYTYMRAKGSKTEIRRLNWFN